MNNVRINWIFTRDVYLKPAKSRHLCPKLRPKLKVSGHPLYLAIFLAAVCMHACHCLDGLVCFVFRVEKGASKFYIVFISLG